MAGKPSGEKTEKPTAKKLNKAKSDGQISHSPELASWLSLLAASFILPGVAKSLIATTETTMVSLGEIIKHPDPGPALAIFRQTMFDGTAGVAPLILLILATAVASHALQGGVHFAPKVWRPKASRLNPLGGVKRMFGPQGLWQLLKSLVKTVLLAAVAYFAVRQLVPTLAASGSLPLASVLDTTTQAAMNVLRFGSAAGLIMSFADVAVVRRRNNKQLKMTKHEVKEEYKSTEGDPQVKNARRSRALELSRNRMMADIPQADVVLVNPTHVAVALRYDPAKGAPRVVAKGADHLAAKIRKVAEDNRVPMVQDIALARTLYATCDLGAEIPPDLYQAVAMVLAFIMRLKKRGAIIGMQKMSPQPVRQ